MKQTSVEGLPCGTSLVGLIGGSSELPMRLMDGFLVTFLEVEGTACIHITHMWRGHSHVAVTDLCRGHSCVGVTHVWRGHSSVGVTHMWRGHSRVGVIHVWRGNSRVGVTHLWRGDLNVHVVIKPPVSPLVIAGIVLTACLPIHRGGDTFEGVACVDMLMRDLISDLTAFQNLDIAYTFMLDSAGITNNVSLLSYLEQDVGFQAFFLICYKSFMRQNLHQGYIFLNRKYFQSKLFVIPICYDYTFCNIPKPYKINLKMYDWETEW